MNSDSDTILKKTLSAAAREASDTNADVQNSWQQFQTEVPLAYQNYQPSAEAIGKLKSGLADCRIVAIGGSWCSDTRREIPRLCKVLDACRFPESQYAYYPVDRSKKPTSDFIAGDEMAFSFVPAIFLIKDGKVAGKIIEVAQHGSVESDLVYILEHPGGQ